MSESRYDRRTLLKNVLVGMAAVPAANLVRTAAQGALRISTKRIRWPSRSATCTTRRRSMRTRFLSSNPGAPAPTACNSSARKETSGDRATFPGQGRQRRRLVQGVGGKAEMSENVTADQVTCDAARAVTSLCLASSRFHVVPFTFFVVRRIPFGNTSFAQSNCFHAGFGVSTRSRHELRSSPPADICGCIGDSSETLPARDPDDELRLR